MTDLQTYRGALLNLSLDTKNATSNPPAHLGWKWRAIIRQLACRPMVTLEELQTSTAQVEVPVDRTTNIVHATNMKLIAV